MNSLLAFPSLAAFVPKLAAFGLMLAQATDDMTGPQVQQNPVAGAVGGVVGLLIVVIAIVSLWKIFTKAGQPGWASIVPIYNLYVLCKVAGKPGWWLLLMLIPFVNFVIIILIYVGLAKNFGKGGGFALGMIVLSFIFLPILAFGDARYQGTTPPPLV